MSVKAKNNSTNLLDKVKPKVLVILGPTASGKTDLGIDLARKFGGEIISADSRQVYRGLDIGSGKDLIKYSRGGAKVKYHLIDVASPKERFDLAKYQRKALEAIEDVLGREKLPIIVGGSGLYLQALVDNYDLSASEVNLAKRNENEKLSAEELLAMIKKLKPEFATHLNNSDSHNPRRLARYLEIIESGEHPSRKKKESPYNFLILGLTWSDAILKERILQRILERLEKEAMIAEVKRLHDEGLSWERLKSFGLEYKFISKHLLGELSYKEMIDKLTTASYRFAKRQKTWFKRWEKQGTKIEWLKNSLLKLNGKKSCLDKIKTR
jgi:tRNA dimethylallyltransferase